MPVIPATWEEEIRKIVIEASPEGEKSVRPHINQQKLGMVACICCASYARSLNK
jgi:hypothetical protein